MDSKKKKKRVIRKASKLFISLGITSVILVVATYAWFIGTLQVTVTGIEIQINTKEGLTISLDGQSWANTVTVTEAAVTTALEEIYSTNTNSWVDEEEHGGLLPVSTVGKLDTTHSVLELYNKTSITALKGGYRVRTNKIENVVEDAVQESGEYVAFDIFIKNTSGEGYNATYAPDEDEGVYLINDSYAQIMLNDDNEAVGDGIQNSARIGMFNIGRVGLNASLSAIQGIKCAGGGSGDDTATGLCNLGEDTTATEANEAPRGQGITWNIYEPNDKSHIEKSVQRFNRICKKKTLSEGNIVYSDDECSPIADESYVYTYAVHGPIASEDNVNIFDGLNTFTDNVFIFDGEAETPTYDYTDGQKLTKMEYYKDSDIFDDNENTRHEVLRLAPNSITKMRIYIWIEGQDVDNFDVTTQDDDGNIKDVKIKFQFGFTKDRFAYLNVDPGELEHGEPEPEP